MELLRAVKDVKLPALINILIACEYKNKLVGSVNG
jgi:hypothetical protein